MKNYRGDGRVEALFFSIDGVGYKLPSETEKVFERMRETYPRKNKQWVEEQSERVAWRVLKDWLDAQVSLIYIGQAKLEQIMLPYAYDGKRSFYEIIKERGDLKRLTDDSENKQDVKEVK